MAYVCTVSPLILPSTRIQDNLHPGWEVDQSYISGWQAKCHHRAIDADSSKLSKCLVKQSFDKWIVLNFAVSVSCIVTLWNPFLSLCRDFVSLRTLVHGPDMYMSLGSAVDYHGMPPVHGRIRYVLVHRQDMWYVVWASLSAKRAEHAYTNHITKCSTHTVKRRLSEKSFIRTSHEVADSAIFNFF